MLKRLFKILIGFVLVPVCIGTSQAFYDLLGSLRAAGRAPRFFLGGIITYVGIHLLFFKLDYLYVLGHEAVHAVFTWIFGGAVKSFRVSAKGGSVATTKSNFLISLAPYFFPLYTVLISLIFLVAQFFFKAIFEYTNVFMYLVGFSLAFHLIMTADTLKTKQPDLAENGYVFSLTLIYILNILILALSLSFIFENVKMFPFLKDAFHFSRDIVWVIREQLFGVPQ